MEDLFLKLVTFVKTTKFLKSIFASGGGRKLCEYSKDVLPMKLKCKESQRGFN